jgi:hypothetical protein
MLLNEKTVKVAKAICEIQIRIWKNENWLGLEEINFSDYTACVCHGGANCLTIAQAAVAAMEEANETAAT